MHSYRPLIPQLLTVLFLLVVCRGTVEAVEQRVSFSIPALGVVDQGGKLVGAIPEKLRGAAQSGLSLVLIPKGQLRTKDWDVRPLAESLRLTVLEVGTLREAYEKITGRRF